MIFSGYQTIPVEHDHGRRKSDHYYDTVQVQDNDRNRRSIREDYETITVKDKYATSMSRNNYERLSAR